MIVTNVLLLGVVIWLVNISLDLSRIARAIERLKKEEKTMSKFGTDEGYIEKECEECGRVRVVHYSDGVDICEKCRWCPQLGRFVTDEEFYEDDFGEEKDWFGKPYKEGVEE